MSAPTDPLVHSRAWKAQMPYLARTSRVVTIDPRGNGRSYRPESSAAYADTEFASDTIAEARRRQPRHPGLRPVESDGATRAAALLAELI